MGIDFAQFITDTNRAQTIEEAFGLLQSSLQTLGFDRVVYSLITDHPTLNQKRGHGILRNYPEDWMKYYFEKDYVDVDPVIKLIKQTNGPFLWQDLRRRPSITERMEIGEDGWRSSNHHGRCWA